MSFVNFFNKTGKISNKYENKDENFLENKDEKNKYHEHDEIKNERDEHEEMNDYDEYDEREEREKRREEREKRREEMEKRREERRNEREEQDETEDYEDREKYRRNRDTEEYNPKKDQNIKNLDNFLYKKNIQILKIFKMKNRCILLLVLMKELSKCVLIYVDPSKYQIECQYNNSIVGRENIHDIELFRIDHKHIYEVCDCYPELMKLTQNHRIDIQNEKNKVYLNHFEQICIQLNNFKKIVNSSKSKLGIITEYSISFINNENDVELFKISETSPNKFSKMKTYLLYDLNTFMNNIDEIEFEIERLVPSFIDELTKDNKELRKQIETNSTLNNINSIRTLLDKLEIKKKGLMRDSKQLKEMFKTSKNNLNKVKHKRENVQQRFTVEKFENTKQEIMYFSIDVDDEYNNLLSHTLNLMNLIDKQCQNINEHIEYIKNYCEFD